MTDKQIARPLSPPEIDKLSGYDFYQSIGSPKYLVAPMVDASELAWRILSRLFGAQLAYTPMINANMFNAEHPKYCHEQFDLEALEEGSKTLDRPVIAQFCSNNPTQFYQAAMRLASAGVCDAIDLNLGCPQGIARRGHYGAFLQEDMPLIESMIHHLHVNLPIPVTAKFRVLDTVEDTVAYARMLERAGAQMITVHGRTRAQKGNLSGLADWAKIRAVKAAITSIPVFANGNILIGQDISDCIEQTGCDGVMSAEGNLYNPALFQNLSNAGSSYLEQLPETVRSAVKPHLESMQTEVCAKQGYPRSIAMSRLYLDIVLSLKTQTALSAVKAHLFKMLRPFINVETYFGIRDKLSSPISNKGDCWRDRIQHFNEILDDLELLVKTDENSIRESAWKAPASSKNLLDAFPIDILQPHLRPLPESKKDAEEMPAAKRQKLSAPQACEKTGCPNMGAARCTVKMCSECCALGNADCEIHAAKANKVQEKKAYRRALKEQKKKAKAKTVDPAEITD